MSNFNQTQVDKKLLKLLQRILIQLHLIFFIFLEPKHSDDLKKPRFLRDKGTGCDLM